MTMKALKSAYRVRPLHQIWGGDKPIIGARRLGLKIEAKFPTF